MLVLSRKVGEAVMIGDNIRIMLVDIRGDKVRLGIAAPPEVIVGRLEVHEKRQNFFREGPDLIPTPSRSLQGFATLGKGKQPSLPTGAHALPGPLLFGK
jgi:carbon storage regulator